MNRLLDVLPRLNGLIAYVTAVLLTDLAVYQLSEGQVDAIWSLLGAAFALVLRHEMGRSVAR